jgi:hypothetical protein
LPNEAGFGTYLEKAAMMGTLLCAVAGGLAMMVLIAFVRSLRR